MKKPRISKLFLYRYRFYIGFILLGLAFVALLFTLPLISPKGLSDAEMASAVSSANLNLHHLLDSDLIDLPYHLLQKISIAVFGLTAYAIKLPSIIIGLFLGLLLVLLLNRWFKSNVALLSSILVILSTPFLFLTGNGTPLIMLVFWPTFLLWLGSKIQGVKRPRPAPCFVFAFALLLSIFTPHLIYLALFILLFAIIQPHLRFTIKTLPRFPLILVSLIILGGLAALGYSLSQRPTALATLLLSEDFNLAHFFSNLSAAFAPFFSWSSNLEGTLLSPLIGLPSLALALIGLFSTTRGFFASRNSIASCFIVFAVVLSGFNPDSAILLILPLAILIAHGLRFILEKWYSLFPENPYARIFAIIPISVFLGIMIISGLSQFIFGYRYNPSVANQFTDDLALIRHSVPTDALLVVPESSLAFYQIMPEYHVVVSVPDDYIGTVAALEPTAIPPITQISRIITSPKSANSDRIYLYTNEE